MDNLLLPIAKTSSDDTLYVEDVFSTYLYEGTGASLDIVNGIDLATEGGMVWIKQRDITRVHYIYDTERGALNSIFSDLTEPEVSYANTLTSFNTNGFSLGTSNRVNDIGEYVSWTFRKAPRFFDVVTYTGNGVSGREIAHNLGVAPGMIIVKRLNGASTWPVYHKSVANTKYLRLNTTDAETTRLCWNDTTPTNSVFTVGGAGVDTNTDTVTYVAYLFAHDPLGPSGDGSDGMIACGSYTGNTSTLPEIDLGWEAQYVLIKRADSAEDWLVYDIMRGLPAGGDSAELCPNATYTENGYFGSSQPDIMPIATGFAIQGTSSPYNANGATHIFMAIRRPMKTPESASEVFAIDVGDNNGSATNPEMYSGFPVDAVIIQHKGTNTYAPRMGSRLTGTNYQTTFNTAVEASDGSQVFDFMDGFFNSTLDSNYVAYMFKRAPGFMDVVCYTGTGVAHTEGHNLGVVPEMIIVKSREVIKDWCVYTEFTGHSAYTKLNINDGTNYGVDIWNNTLPTDSVFSVKDSTINNESTKDFIAILFATLAGISKVGSFTGNGTNQTIDCGFSAGAKFVLIKRTDSNGDWYLWDTERGIVAGNDPHLSLNTTAAEVITDDSIDPVSSGFIVNQVAATNINVNTAEYIYLAIA